MSSERAAVHSPVLLSVWKRLATEKARVCLVWKQRPPRNSEGFIWNISWLCLNIKRVDVGWGVPSEEDLHFHRPLQDAETQGPPPSPYTHTTIILLTDICSEALFGWCCWCPSQWSLGDERQEHHPGQVTSHSLQMSVLLG